MEVICVPLIVSAVFSIMEGYKFGIAKNNKILMAIIPAIAAALGVIFGVILFFVWPSAIGVENALTAVIVGGASGLSATGANQIFKQLCKIGINVKNQKEEDESFGNDGRNQH